MTLYLDGIISYALDFHFFGEGDPFPFTSECAGLHGKQTPMTSPLPLTTYTNSIRQNSDVYCISATVFKLVLCILMDYF